jgi:hypothetical protein
MTKHTVPTGQSWPTHSEVTQPLGLVADSPKETGEWGAGLDPWCGVAAPASGVSRLAMGARARQSGGDSVLGGGEEKESPKEELHSGAWRAGRCAGEGPLRGSWQPAEWSGRSASSSAAPGGDSGAGQPPQLAGESGHSRQKRKMARWLQVLVAGGVLGLRMGALGQRRFMAQRDDSLGSSMAHRRHGAEQRQRAEAVPSEERDGKEHLASWWGCHRR